ncbi:MAG TPA: hypothetical protein VF058_02015 [Actinomycetota bacterium]
MIRDPLPSIGIGLSLLAALLVASWLFVAIHHVDDRFNVGWVEGTRIALVWEADAGHFYPPLYDGESFGGTRFMPIPILLHQGLAQLTGEYLASGKLLAYLTTLVLLTLTYRVMRRLRCPRPASFAITAGVLVTAPGLLAATTAQGDALAVAMQLGAVAIVAPRPRDPAATIAAGALCSFAVLSKVSAIWAPVALGAWLLAERRRLTLLLFVVSFVLLLSAQVLILQTLTEGRMLENLRTTLLAGVTGPAGILGSPLRLVNLLGGIPLLWAVLPVAVIGGAIWGSEDSRPFYLSLLTAFLVVLVVLADEGTVHNHLLDVTVLSLLFIGILFGRTTEVSPAVALVLGSLLLWSIGTSYLLELWPATREAGIEVVRGIRSSRYDPRPLGRVIRPGESLLSEDPYVAVALDRPPVVLDAWTLLRLGRASSVPADSLARRIEAREFDWIVLVRPIEDEEWYSDVHFGTIVADAISGSYRIQRQASGYHVYVPRR